MSYYAEITVQEAEEKILSNSEALILDARDAWSYRESHIDGAMQAHDNLVEHLIGQGEFHKPVLIYCYHGISSKSLAELFGRAGFRHAFSMQGGYTAWKKRGILYASEPYPESVNSWLQMEGFERQSLNATVPGEVTPLMLACQQGKTEIAEAFIQAGADPGLVDSEGHTALWAACDSNSLPCTELLLTAGADINFQNQQGGTVLMHAAAAGKLDVVEYLIGRGADISIKNRKGLTARELTSVPAMINLLKSRKQKSR